MPFTWFKQPRFLNIISIQTSISLPSSKPKCTSHRWIQHWQLPYPWTQTTLLSILTTLLDPMTKIIWVPLRRKEFRLKSLRKSTAKPLNRSAHQTPVLSILRTWRRLRVSITWEQAAGPVHRSRWNQEPLLGSIPNSRTKFRIRFPTPYTTATTLILVVVGVNKETARLVSLKLGVPHPLPWWQQPQIRQLLDSNQYRSMAL